MAHPDMDQFPNAFGTAVLDRQTGCVLSVTGDFEGEEAANNLLELHQAFLDAIEVIGDDPLRRVTVAFREIHYAMTVGEGGDTLCIVKLPADR